MDEWEAMVSFRTAASYYMQGCAVSVSGVSQGKPQLDSPMSAHGTVNAASAAGGVSREKFKSPPRLSHEEEPDASAGSQEEEEEPKAPEPIIKRKPAAGRARKRLPPVQSNLGGNNSGGSAFQPDSSSSPISAHGVNVLMSELQFPSVMCRMTPSYLKRPFYLTLPAKFARQHLPRTSQIVRLQDEKSRMWRINLLVRPERTMLASGWETFVRDNRLKIGETCRQEAVFKVTIYKSNTSPTIVELE